MEKQTSKIVNSPWSEMHFQVRDQVEERVYELAYIQVWDRVWHNAISDTWDQIREDTDDRK